MESFWGTMKNELVYHKHYKTREQELREIIEYILISKIDIMGHILSLWHLCARVDELIIPHREHRFFH